MNEANDRERAQEPEAGPTSDEHRNRQHRGFATYVQDTLDVHALLGATVEERLAALRRVREVNSYQHDGIGEDTEERRGQRGQVTARLRERFRILTRPHRDS